MYLMDTRDNKCRHWIEIKGPGMELRNVELWKTQCYSIVIIYEVARLFVYHTHKHTHTHTHIYIYIIYTYIYIHTYIYIYI